MDPSITGRSRYIGTSVEQHLNHLSVYARLDCVMQRSPAIVIQCSETYDTAVKQFTYKRRRGVRPQCLTQVPMRAWCGGRLACRETRPLERHEFDSAIGCAFSLERHVHDTPLVERGLLEDLVELPAIAVGKASVPDAGHVGVVEHLGAVGFQRLVQTLGLDERDDGRAVVRRHLEEGVVGCAASGGVLGDHHRRVGGVPAEGVQERVHERGAGAYLVRADGVAVAAYALLERRDDAHEGVEVGAVVRVGHWSFFSVG